MPIKSVKLNKIFAFANSFFAFSNSICFHFLVIRLDIVEVHKVFRKQGTICVIPSIQLLVEPCVVSSGPNGYALDLISHVEAIAYYLYASFGYPFPLVSTVHLLHEDAGDCILS